MAAAGKLRLGCGTAMIASMGGRPKALEPLTTRFTAQLDLTARTDARAQRQLASALASMFEAGRAAWPELEVPPGTYGRYLADRVEQTDDVVAALSKLQPGDLYLACACAGGDVAALALFDQHLGPGIDAGLRRVHTPPQVIQDVRQALRKKLFVADGAAPPDITKYGGRGSLLAWACITAVRMALEAMKRTHREISAPDALLHAVTPDADDPELHYLKSLYRQEFKEAFHEAMGALTSRDRLLLKHHLVDRVSVDGIAAMYDVHRATAARWLTRIREGVAQHTRRRMVERLRIARDECDSILQLIRSQLDLSISTYLRSARSER